MVDWLQLQDVANNLTQSRAGPGNSFDFEWRQIEQAVRQLKEEENWEGLIRLREILNDLYAKDTVAGLDVIQALDKEAILSARKIGNTQKLAHFLGDLGHNLHRRGFHEQAIHAFDESSTFYLEIGNQKNALYNLHMTSLCYRAVGQYSKAYHICQNVLASCPKNDPWRGNPLQFMAILCRDKGERAEAERLLCEALDLHKQALGSDILVAGTLTNLGEVMGLQGKIVEAKQCFSEALAILDIYSGEYNRQEARTKTKLAELLIQTGNITEALSLLNEADDLIRAYGHYYDLLWKIEIFKAQAYYKNGQYRTSISKLRSGFVYRKVIGLSHRLLVWAMLRQVWAALASRARFLIKNQNSS